MRSDTRAACLFVMAAGTNGVLDYWLLQGPGWPWLISAALCILTVALMLRFNDSMLSWLEWRHISGNWYYVPFELILKYAIAAVIGVTVMLQLLNESAAPHSAITFAYGWSIIIGGGIGLLDWLMTSKETDKPISGMLPFL